MHIGLVFDRFGDRLPPPGAPPDWDAEYEPEATIAALEAGLAALGHTTVRLGSAEAFLAQVPAVQAGTLRLEAVLSIAEGYGTRNREAHAPTLCELLGIPHLGSDALTLSLALDKAWTKDLVRTAGVLTPLACVVPPSAPWRDDDLPGPFPLFVKPRYEGTAKGIAPTSRCDDRDALRREVARQQALYGQDLLVEAFVPGREFTVAVVGNAPARALPVLERATERATGIGLHALERHEGDAPFAYDLGGPLTPALEADLHAAALAVYHKLEVRDFARLDFRVDPDGQVWFLEINPLPTFAPDGTFAIIAELAGLSYPAFLAEVFGSALRRLQGP